MNFDKIYSDFDAAREIHDLETMSDIIKRVNDHCGELARTGRANEIPPEANEIAAHVNVMIYFVMKLLGDGNASKARHYLGTFENPGGVDLNINEGFFFMYYLFGRMFYLEGDFFRAEEFFTRYEGLRMKKFGDVDELSLFYRANCLAFTGKFFAAAQLYERILQIKANFPEVKRNLERLRRGNVGGLVRELSSLRYFTNWRDVPIFINARDRLGVMKRMIDWLLDAGYRKLIILDNLSTYPPLLEYYRALDGDSRVKVIRLEKNFGYKALWLSGVPEQLKIATPYVYTDPDLLPVEDCPKDFVRRFMDILDDNRELRKVGFGLVWDDITFFNKDWAQRTQRNFYEGTQVGDELYYAAIDTTFALYSNVRHYNVRFSARTTGDLMAYHLPWYFDYDNLPPDEKYYVEHAEPCAGTATQFKQR